MSMVELCLVLEQQGRTVAPIPLIPCIVESAMTIAESNNQALKDDILPKVMAGDFVLSAAGPYQGVQDVEKLSVQKSNDGYVLNGRTSFALYPGMATGFIVNASVLDTEIICYLPCEYQGVSIVEQIGISDEPAGYLELDNVEIDASFVVAEGAEASKLMADQKARSWIAQAALQTGVLDEGLKRAAQYVSERKQFGRVLGSFQAVSQQAADAYMEIESLRSAYWRALDDVEQGLDYQQSAAVAKYWVSTAGHAAAHTFLHLHGGIGQDLDYPIHRYFLWAKQYERYAGAKSSISSIVGDLLLEAV